MTLGHPNLTMVKFLLFISPKWMDITYLSAWNYELLRDRDMCNDTAIRDGIHRKFKVWERSQPLKNSNHWCQLTNYRSQ